VSHLVSWAQARQGCGCGAIVIEIEAAGMSIAHAYPARVGRRQSHASGRLTDIGDALPERNGREMGWFNDLPRYLVPRPRMPARFAQSLCRGSNVVDFPAKHRHAVPSSCIAGEDARCTLRAKALLIASRIPVSRLRRARSP